MGKGTSAKIAEYCRKAYACGRRWSIRYDAEGWDGAPSTGVVMQSLTAEERETFNFLLPGTWWLQWRRGWADYRSGLGGVES